MLDATTAIGLVKAITSPEDIKRVFREVILPSSSSIESARQGMAFIFGEVWNGDPKMTEGKKQVQIWELALAEEFRRSRDVIAVTRQNDARILTGEISRLLYESVARTDYEKLLKKIDDLREAVLEMKDALI